MIFVNYEDCTGCGACMDACEFNAILLQNDKATIDQEQCEGCQACIEACPLGAIYVSEIDPQPEKIMIKAEPGTVEIRNDPAPTKGSLRDIVLPALGSALLWTGQELVPRLANFALKTLDQQISSADSGRKKEVQSNTRGRNRPASSQKGGRRRRLRQRRNKRI